MLEAPDARPGHTVADGSTEFADHTAELLTKA
jgi:hypothetical protein